VRIFARRGLESVGAICWGAVFGGIALKAQLFTAFAAASSAAADKELGSGV